MEHIVSCVHSDGMSSQELQAVEKSTEIYIRQFIANEFIVGEAGHYNYDNKIWHLEKEGFYQFVSGENKMRKYLFKEDIFLFMTLLDSCCEYSGDYQPREHVEILGFGLSQKNEENLPKLAFTTCMLRSAGIPHRHISLYSPVVGNSLFDWVEIWDSTQNSWTLYWLDKNIYLGKTNKERTCFNVFDELINGKVDFTSFAEPKKRLNDFLMTKPDVLDSINEAIFDNSKQALLLKNLQVFPIIRSDGYQMLEVYSLAKYRDKMPSDTKQVYLDGTQNLAYNLSFVDNEYVLNDIYAPQLYIMKGRYVNIL